MPPVDTSVAEVVQLIVASGEVTAEWFQDEDCVKFEHGDRWISFCGTIPAFAYVIVHETMIRNGPGLVTAKQDAFFRTVEDELYKVYKAGFHVPLDECLLLDSELWPVCKRLDCFPDTYASTDTILGMILPNRLTTYQKDWSSGLCRVREGHRDINFLHYAAMRLAADLTGITTPPSLVGQSIADLGIERYGSASIALTQFVGSYLDAFP